MTVCLFYHIHYSSVSFKIKFHRTWENPEELYFVPATKNDRHISVKVIENMINTSRDNICKELLSHHNYRETDAERATDRHNTRQTDKEKR